MRNYFVKQVNEDGTVSDGRFVLAKSPKLAAEKIAPRMTSWREYRGKFRVFTLQDGRDLSNCYERTYIVRFDRHVRDVERATIE